LLHFIEFYGYFAGGSNMGCQVGWGGMPSGLRGGSRQA